jgi:putative nucleotidyltransferase with HDIG domain
MITKEEALHLIKRTSKYAHAVTVSQIMRKLAIRLGEDEEKWELVGLLHDLDYDLVREDMSQHGILASEQLKGQLPEDCLYAIKSHDYRTGFTLQSTLDKALSLADLIVWINEQVASTITTIEELNSAIERITTIEPWLKQDSLRSEELGISKTELLKMMKEI